MPVVALIQARMSSARFPGKVLAPFRGRALIDAVVDQVRAVDGLDGLAVLTSSEPSDDPLVSHLSARGVTTFRGPLEDVFSRFRAYLLTFPVEWFLRVSADSPLLDPTVLERLLRHPRRARADIITTIFPRTFPKGRNGELIRTATFMSVDERELARDDREHVTPFFYRNASRFVIESVTSDVPMPDVSYAVDTVADLRRLERDQAFAQSSR